MKVLLLIGILLSFYCDTTAQQIIEAKSLRVTQNFQMPLDTVIARKYPNELRFRIQDSSFYVAFGTTGRIWHRLTVTPTVIQTMVDVPDTLALINSRSPGVSLFWITPGLDSVGMKKFVDGNNTTVVQNGDSSLQINVPMLSATTTLNFPATAARRTSSLTTIVQGAQEGDAIVVGAPGISSLPGLIFVARCKALNVVVITMYNSTGATVNPPAGKFRVKVLQQ
jgi:hypothetical protein